MKPSIIFGLSILMQLSLISAQAQVYLPILGEQNEWYVNTTGPGLTVDDLFYTQSDTIIDSIRYHPLYAASHFQFVSDEFLGYLKEDSIRQRLTFFESDFMGGVNWNDEKLLYDFDIQEGDTIVVQSQENYPFSPFVIDTLVLDSIRDKNGGGKIDPNWIADSLRVFYLRTIRETVFAENQDIIWIEGSGSISYLLSPTVGSFGPSQLNCHFYNGELRYRLYGTVDDTCRFGASSLEPTHTAINLTVFPNPIHKQAEIQFDNPNNEIRWISLYAQSGQHIWTKQTRESQLPFSRSGLASGLYHLRIRNEKQFLTAKSLQFQ